MQHDSVEILEREQPVAAHGRILRAHSLERAAREVPREDDVHHVLAHEWTLGSDRVHDRDRPFEWNILVDAELLSELTLQRVDQAFTRVHPTPRQEPILLSGLLVPAEEDRAAPVQESRDADARFADHARDDPKPRSPRSLAGNSSTSSSSTAGSCTTTSCAMRIPASTANASSRSVFRITP